MLNIVKNTTLIGPLDLLFPHSCRGCGRIGEVLCERCKKYILNRHQDFCPNCKQHQCRGRCSNCPDLPPIYVVSARDEYLGKLIKDYKYHSVRALVLPLAKMLDSILPNNLPKDACLVPLPTATNHIRSRGFDHTLLLAKKLARLRHLKVQKLLKRSKNTVQVGSDRKKRLSQAKSAYTLNPKIKIDPKKTYILIDDVWTTGASLLSAKKLLEKAGAKKFIIAVLAYSS